MIPGANQHGNQVTFMVTFMVPLLLQCVGPKRVCKPSSLEGKSATWSPHLCWGTTKLHDIGSLMHFSL